MKKCCQVAEKKSGTAYKKWGVRIVYFSVSLILIIVALKQVLNF